MTGSSVCRAWNDREIITNSHTALDYAPLIANFTSYNQRIIQVICQWFLYYLSIPVLPAYLRNEAHKTVVYVDAYVHAVSEHDAVVKVTDSHLCAVGLSSGESRLKQGRITAVHVL